MKCDECNEEMSTPAYEAFHGDYCSGYCCDMGFERATGALKAAMKGSRRRY